MKNIEKYKKEISNLVNKGSSLECSIATVAGIREEKPCFDQVCKECHNKCIEWMCSEYNEPILTEEEKTIVESMIYVLQKIGCTVKNVTKYDNGRDKAYIGVNYTNEITGACARMTTPWFKNNKFKGMKADKEYTLEELGITCQTQKDSFGRR